MYIEKSFQTHDGLQLYYRDYPGDSAKTPVLCLHGLTRSCRDFEKIAAHISPGRRVLAMDQRGRGGSQFDPNWVNYHPGVYVEDTLALLREADAERVIVIGSSLGGIIAMLMAAVRPRVFAGVVLNDIGPELDPVGIARIQTYAGRMPPIETWDDAVEHVRSMFTAAFPDFTDAQWREFARLTFVDEDGRPRVAADPKIGDALRAIPPPPGATQMMWLAFGALRSTPVLVLRGAHSDLLSVNTLKRMRREHPGLIAVTVPDRGHLPQLDEPESMQAIDAFLAQIG